MSEGAEAHEGEVYCRLKKAVSTAQVLSRGEKADAQKRRMAPPLTTQRADTARKLSKKKTPRGAAIEEILAPPPLLHAKFRTNFFGNLFLLAHARFEKALQDNGKKQNQTIKKNPIGDKISELKSFSSTPPSCPVFCSRKDFVKQCPACYSASSASRAPTKAYLEIRERGGGGGGRILIGPVCAFRTFHFEAPLTLQCRTAIKNPVRCECERMWRHTEVLRGKLQVG